mgnify:CR=1 FL=1
MEKRNLTVINTHAHWDHVLGNKDFEVVSIHEREAWKISKPYDVSFLRDSPSELIEAYEQYKYVIPPASKVNLLQEGDIFDLGNVSVRVLHCPGHSPGSICLLTDKNDLFTGDVAYYGEQFLPGRKDHNIILESLERLLNICEAYEALKIYPSHCRYPCDKSLLKKLRVGITQIDEIWDERKVNDFFQAFELDNGNFKYYISRW